MFDMPLNICSNKFSTKSSAKKFSEKKVEKTQQKWNVVGRRFKKQCVSICGPKSCQERMSPETVNQAQVETSGAICSSVQHVCVSDRLLIPGLGRTATACFLMSHACTLFFLPSLGNVGKGFPFLWHCQLFIVANKGAILILVYDVAPFFCIFAAIFKIVIEIPSYKRVFDWTLVPTKGKTIKYWNHSKPTLLNFKKFTAEHELWIISTFANLLM